MTQPRLDELNDWFQGLFPIESYPVEDYLRHMPAEAKKASEHNENQEVFEKQLELTKPHDVLDRVAFMYGKQKQPIKYVSLKEKLAAAHREQDMSRIKADELAKSMKEVAKNTQSEL